MICGISYSGVVAVFLLFILSVSHLSSPAAVDLQLQTLYLALQGAPHVRLLHKDSLQPSSLNLHQRVQNAVLYSNARIEYLASIISKHRYSSIRAPDSTSAAVSNKTFVAPLYSRQGTYVMNISIGTPAKIYLVSADTGSDLCWIQCKPCPHCDQQPDPMFDPKNSRSYKKLSCSSAFCTALDSHVCNTTCQYKYEYEDQSGTAGDMATETVTLITDAGKKTAFRKFAFGCGHENQGALAGTDGLLGLGKGPLSFTSQLGKYFGNKFSYCLVSFYDAPNKSSPLVFGNAPLPPSTKFRYTPLVNNPANPSFYYVGVIGLAVNNVDLKIPSGAFEIDWIGNGGLFLDSGTILSYLIPEAYSPLLKQMITLMSKYPTVDGSEIGLDLCVDLSGVPNPQFPKLTFHFSSLDVTLPGTNVFLQVDNQGTTCFAFLSSDIGVSIFGNVQQQNFLIQYDMTKSRVGFATTQCDAIR